MSTKRFGYLDDLSLKNTNVGIGTSTANEKLEVLGGIRGGGTVVTGIATLASYSGFDNTKFTTTGDVLISGGESGTLSGEVVIGAGLTMTVGTGATTGQGSIKSLKVSNTFNPPIGSSDERPSAPKPGALYYNKDFKTIEYWDCNFLRQVDNVEKGGGSRAVMGGGSSNVSPATNYMTQLSYKDISTLGNFETFGDLGYNVYGAEGVCDGTRGLMMGGYANPGNTNMISYITVQSQGNAIDFGDTTVTGRGTLGGGNSSTRGIVGGIGYPSNITIDYVEIQTTGNALDFGDLTSSRTTGQGSSSPTRTFWYGGEASPTTSAVIDMVTTASKGNSIDFGRLTTIGRGRAAGGNTVRGIIAGGNSSSRTPSGNIQTIIYASQGNATDFGYLTRIRENAAAATNNTRIVFVAGEAPGVYVNICDFVTINTGGAAQDFGDIGWAMGDMGMCSATNGGLGGF